MKPQTLTTIDKLEPGNIFCLPSGQLEFIKLEDRPLIKYKMKFECHAVPVDSITPRAFRKNTDVVFIANSLIHKK